MGSLLVQQYLDLSSHQAPHKVAVTDGNVSLRYFELDKYSNRLANGLVACGVKRQERVLICMQRSIEVLIVIHGILKSDAVYVPLDCKTPHERWKDILYDCSPTAVVCDKHNRDKVLRLIDESGGGTPVLELLTDYHANGVDIAWVAHNCSLASYSDYRPYYNNTVQDLASVLYTSGTTGRPKGVMISHQNISSYIEWAVDYFRITREDLILGTSPFHFDMSTFDIYCSLKAGGTVCVANEMSLLFPTKLVDFIEQNGVTLWKGVSSLLMYMAATKVLSDNRMPTLKTIIFAGEPLSTKHLLEWMNTYPDKVFYNGYGPTEATGVSLCYQVLAPPGSPLENIPIGPPRQGMKVYLYSEDNTPVNDGEVGEICLAGPGLSPGYMNDPLKTNKAFIINPTSAKVERIYRSGDLAVLLPCGNYQFAGRKDRQIKFMGYRIEAGEIERAIVALEGVRDAAVVLQESDFNKETSEVVAFVETSEKLMELNIPNQLKDRLPAYMLPKRIVQIEKMPRCNRGKVKYDNLNMYIDP